MSAPVLAPSCGVSVFVGDIPQPPADACVDSINVYRLGSTWDTEKGFKEAQQYGDLRHQGYHDVFTEAHWFLVASVPVGTTQFIDSLDSHQLGRLLTTWDFFPPPDALRIVGETSSGSLVGYVGDVLWFSERNAHHAWPPRTRLVLDHKIKRVAVHDNTVFVATTGYPFVVDDSTAECKDAACRAVRPGNVAAPICSERSMVLHDGAAYWATRWGFVRMGNDAVVSQVSDRFFSKEDWEQLDPSTMTAAIHNGVLYASTAERSFYVDLQDAGELPIGVVDLTISPVQWLTTEDGRLMLLAGEGHVMEWDAGPDSMAYVWKSRRAVMPGSIRLSAVKVVFGGKVCVDQASGPGAVLTVWRDGRQALLRTVHHNKAMRIRNGRGIEWCVGVHSKATVREIHLGPTVISLVRTGDTP
jgi:hypothetical protein